MHILLHKIFLFLVNACFAIAILHLISLLHLPSSVITEPKYLNCSTCSTWCCPTLFFHLLTFRFGNEHRFSLFKVYSHTRLLLFSPSISLCRPSLELDTIA